MVWTNDQHKGTFFFTKGLFFSVKKKVSESEKKVFVIDRGIIRRKTWISMHSQDQKNAHKTVIAKAKTRIMVFQIPIFLGGSAPEPPSVTSFELDYNTWISKNFGLRPAVKKYVSVFMLSIDLSVRSPRFQITTSDRENTRF